MTLWALVPVKPPDRAKSRLSGCLSAEQRFRLNVTLFEHTLSAIAASDVAGETLVVSASAELRDRAERRGFSSLADSGVDLNGAVQAGAAMAMSAGATALLVVPSDLPRLDCGCLRSFVASISGNDGVVIADDRAGRGTNLLLIRPISGFHFAFGVDSRARHLEEADRLRLTARIIHDDNLAFDVDTPSDYAEFAADHIAV